PRLRRIFLMGSGKDATWLDGVTHCPPELQVRESLEWGNTEDWLKAAEKTNAKVFVFDEFAPGRCHHQFTRDPSGKFTRLETILVSSDRLTSLTPRPRILADAIESLRHLPEKLLTHYEAHIEVDGKMVVAEELVEVGSKALR